MFSKREKIGLSNRKQAGRGPLVPAEGQAPSVSSEPTLGKKMLTNSKTFDINSTVKNLVNKGGKMATKKRKPNAAFMKPVQPDSALSEVVGAKPIPRTEVTKKLWVYIKKNGLQDKKKKIMINADANLKRVFGGKKQVTMFEMTKLVSKHMK